jgi:peptidoglycan/LPS O-acetylase OafA/YrhL
MIRHGATGAIIERITFSRMDSILAGAAAAFIIKDTISEEVRQHQTLMNTLACTCLLALCALFLVAGEFDAWLISWGYTAIALLCATLVGSSVLLSRDRSALCRILSCRLMRWVGKRSYGLYLYHFPIYWALEPLRAHHSLLNFFSIFALRVSLSFTAAALSFRFIESPFLRLKDRFEIYRGRSDERAPLCLVSPIGKRQN